MRKKEKERIRIEKYQYPWICDKTCWKVMVVVLLIWRSWSSSLEGRGSPRKIEFNALIYTQAQWEHPGTTLEGRSFKSSSGRLQKWVWSALGLLNGLWHLLWHDSCLSGHLRWASYVPWERMNNVRPTCKCECSVWMWPSPRRGMGCEGEQLVW